MKLRTAAQVQAEISRVTEDYRHVLDCGPATVTVNAPRAIMQTIATATLDALYWTIGEERPRFECDNRSKINH